MSEVSIDLVKQLRAETGVSIMQCKKALIEAEGDLEKAKITLTKKSGEIAAKKGDRELKSGVVVVQSADDKVVILELACETDFVANNVDFKALAEKVALTTLQGEKVSENDISEAVQKFGERIEVVRSEILEGSDSIGFYVHSNNSVGAVVKFTDSVDAELEKDVAMHVTAQHPQYLKEEDIPEEERRKAEDTLREEVQDKPAEMQDQILAGKMKAFFKERVLLSQAFIKDPSKTVGDLLGESQVEKYIRFGVGE